MGLQSFGWVDGPWRTASGGRPVADGLWRTAPGGRPRRRGPPGRPPGRLPAGRPPSRPADGAAVRHPADGWSGRPAVGWPSAMPSAEWGGRRHAVQQSDGRLPCRPPSRVADGMPSSGHPWGCRTRPDVLRTLTWTSGCVTTLSLPGAKRKRPKTSKSVGSAASADALETGLNPVDVDMPAEALLPPAYERLKKARIQRG
jgi:hypothetical protein